MSLVTGLCVASVGARVEGVDALGVELPQLAKETARSAASEKRRIIVSCLAVAARLPSPLCRRLCLC
jgi:hypothetical protein